MKKTTTLFITVITMVLYSSCSEKLASETLFQENGNDWFEEGDAQWRFENNELIGSLNEGSGFVMTNASYDNFILELEFNPDSAINSGIFIRCKEKTISNEDCYEINIWDLHPDQENRTGAIVTRTTPLEKVDTLDKWNTYKIRNDNDHLQVWINGILTADVKDNDLTEGPIALQAAESGKIMFRNVRITQLD